MAQDNAPAQKDAEIEPLSDESLEDVSGGAGTSCSTAFCSHSAEA